MRQYLRLQANPGVLLIFRMVGCYELFYAESRTRRAAPLLDTTLTDGRCSARQSITMAGVPYHAPRSCPA